MSVRPQLYYLRLDDTDGLYVRTTFALSSKDLPISLSAILNKTVQTDIAGAEFLWNVTLIYSY